MASASRDLLLGHLRRWLPAPSADQLSDEQLLRRFAAEHDEAAFAALMQRHGPLVLGICRRVLHHEHESEDAFQATFLVLARKAGTIRKHQSLSCWLHGVASRVALRARRGLLRRAALPARAVEAVSTDPLAEMSARELVALLDESLQQLPEKYRLPLVLCHLQGQTQDEAARQLGWPRGTLKGRLERGQELLRGRLARRGVTLPAALLAAGLIQQAASAIPPALMAATLRAAWLVVAGKGVAIASAHAASLADGVIRGLFVGRVRMALALVVVFSVLAAGAGLAAQRLLAMQGPGARQVDDPAAPGKAHLPKPAVDDGARTDRFGDPLPPGALARLGTARLRPAGRVGALICGADGASLLSVVWKGTYELDVASWATANGKAIRTSQLPTRWCQAFGLAADGKALATAEYDKPLDRYRVFLREAATGQELRALDGLTDKALTVVFAPDGKLVAAPDKKAIHLWDAATGQELRCCDGPPDEWRRLAFSPDGRTLAAGSVTGNIRLWDTSTGKLLHVLAGHATMVGTLAFAPDGKGLASGADEDPTIHLWDVVRGKHVWAARGECGTTCLAFAPDGKLLAAGDNWSRAKAARRPIRLLDVATGQERAQLKGHIGGVAALTFLPDGARLASAGADAAIRLWDVATGKELLPFSDQEGSLGTLAFAPDGRSILTTGADNSVRLWESSTGKPLRLLERSPEPAGAAVFSPDGRTVIVTGPQGSIRIRDAATGAEVRHVEGSKGAAHVCSSPDGKTLAQWDDQTIQLREAATGKALSSINTEKRVVLVAFATDGRSLISLNMDAKGPWSKAHSWDVATGKELRVVALNRQTAPYAFAAEATTLAAVCHSDRSIHLTDTTTWTERYVLTVPGVTQIFSIALSADGRALAVGDISGAIYLVETATGKVRGRLVGHRAYVHALAFSADGQRLASASSNDAMGLVWDVSGIQKRGQPPTTLSAEAWRALWADLADLDAVKAHRAVATLAGAPEQAVPFLKGKLKPATMDRDRIARLLADLDSDQFTVRQQATQELEELRELAEPMMRKQLEGRPSLEMRTRLLQVLDTPAEPIRLPGRLQALRGLEVLERLGTPEAREILRTLAGGERAAQITREAKASLERLDRQRQGP